MPPKLQNVQTVTTPSSSSSLTSKSSSSTKNSSCWKKICDVFKKKKLKPKLQNTQTTITSSTKKPSIWKKIKDAFKVEFYSPYPPLPPRPTYKIESPYPPRQIPVYIPPQNRPPRVEYNHTYVSYYATGNRVRKCYTATILYCYDISLKITIILDFF